MKPSLITLAALALASGAYAMPALPGTIMARMPDGTEAPLTLHGDEFFHYATTPEGFTLLPDPDKGWVFAQATEKGVQPGLMRYNGAESVRKARAEGSVTNLRPAVPEAARKKAASRATQVDGTFPAKGERRLLMLLVNYSDTEPKYTSGDFDNYMNQPGYKGIGSFRDYYLENSYGQLDITTTVTRWVTLPRTKFSYGSEGAANMIVDALSLLDAEIDLRDFDNDGDGVLDGLAVIHQGTGAEASGSTSEIWSHSSTLYGVEFDGVQVRRYTIQPEQLKDGMSTIGVMCHEFGHNLGAPDFYDTDYEGTGGTFPGTGKWDLMGSGAWNGDLGDRPAGTNMWQKIQLGWAEPRILAESQHVESLAAAHDNPAACRFDTKVPGEYFIIENRQQQGPFDSALTHHGMLIYHVDENLIASSIYANTLNVTYPQAIYTVCAGATTDPGPSASSYGWVDSDEAPFPGSTGKTAFSDTTIPSTRSISGRYSYCGLENILENADGTISFDFATYDTPPSPSNFTAIARKGIVALSWDAPEADTPPVKYNIYRDNSLLASTTSTEYTDSDTGSLTDIAYTVDAEYASGLISPFVSAQVSIPRNFVTGLTASAEGSAVDLRWNLPTRLTRMQGTIDRYTVYELLASSVEVAHRFRAEDLAVYAGYKIRRISFFPVQPQRVATSTLTVYEADPATGALTPVSTRKVTETGVAQWNDIMLTKPVEITPGKELWIAVRFESNNGTVQIISDNAANPGALGSCISVDGGAWEADPEADGSFFIYATLAEPDATAGSPVDIAPGEAEALDFCYPAGFAIYRDGEPIGTTDGRAFRDDNVPAGRHTYTLSSLYRGGNESTTQSVDVDLSTDGITSAEAARPAISVTAAEGTITVGAGAGAATIADATGRVIARVGATRADATVRVPAGVYIVTTSASSVKALVR